jgi:hypothetical protein
MLLPELFHLSAYPFRLARQNIEVGAVDNPGHDVGRIEVVQRVRAHRAPSINDCMASASFTARCATSSR